MQTLSSQQGLSIIEVLVYVILLSLVATSLLLFTMRIVQQTSSARVTSITLDNARGAMAVITSEIRQANAVYTPTSVVGSSPGQLSLVTTRNTPADEDETYVDFYIDDERLYRKREGVAAELVTAEQIKVTHLTFYHRNTGSEGSAVQVTLTVVPAQANAQILAAATVSLTTTATLRAY